MCFSTWNGFPAKSLYGEFPRASRNDKAVTEKKYPYIIHAEQNALLMRNTKSIVDATLIVTMTPCDDCTPLIEMQGIKTVVLGEKMRPDTNFTQFPQRVGDKDDRIVCFEVEKPDHRPRKEKLMISPAVKRQNQSQRVSSSLPQLKDVQIS